jgi:transposase
LAINEISIIGVDLAKQVFQLYGATSEGAVVFRKKLSRKQFLAFMQSQPACCVAMEA